MKRSKWFVCALAALALVGCGSMENDYYAAVKAQAQATEKIGIERARAAGKACEYGDNTACLMSQVMLGMQGATGTGQPALQQVAPPKTFADYALQFTGALAPSLVQGYGAYTQMRLGIAQSDNSTKLGIAQAKAAAATTQSTNNSFVSMGGQIKDTATAGLNATSSTAASGFASNSAISASGFGAASDIAGNGFRAVNSVGVGGIAATYGIASAGFNSNAAIAGNIQAPQPNITISGTGSVNTGAGNSSFAQTASSGSVIGAGTANTLGGNGVIGSGSYTRKDCTSTGAPSGSTGPGGSGTGATGTGASGTGTTGTATGGSGTGGSGMGAPSGNTGPGGAATVGC